MERVYCVLVLSLRLVLSQYAQSPCPGVFDYASDGAYVYGVVQLVPNATISSLTIRTNFTVAAQLISNYAGRIEAEDSARLLRKYNSGVPVTVRVHFPVTSPPPRLTALSVNGNTICSGPAEFRPGEYITILSLQHTSYPRGGGIVDIPRPQRRLDPDRPPSRVSAVNSIDIYEAWSNDNKPFHIKNTQIIYNRRPEHVSNQTRPFYDQQPQQIDRPPSRPFNERPTFTVNEQNGTPAPIGSHISSSSSIEECGVVSGGNEQVPLIRYGESYARGDIPWLVAIYWRKLAILTFICEGTLISDRHVVTAAHCMKWKSDVTPIKEFVIRVGVHDLNEWSDEITVTRSIVSADIHDAYNTSNFDNDLMVVTLDRKVKFHNYIRPVCLWTGDPDLNIIVGASGVVAGWGEQGTPKTYGQGVPHMVRMPIVSNAQCLASNVGFHHITSSKTLCAGDRNGAGPCVGDSGGGLYVLEGGRWRLRGVLSRSLANANFECDLNEYIVFTDVAKYVDWIKKILAKNFYNWEG